MKNIETKTILLFAGAAAFAAYADASLYNDPAAMPGYTDKTLFEVTQSGIKLEASVEYAVYAPGTYPGNNIAGSNKYIYAYQIFNLSKQDVAIDFFSVGIAGSARADNVYFDNTYGYSPATAVSPLMSNIFAQSAGFIFAGQNLNPHDWSSVLIFTSNSGPANGNGTVSGGGLSGMCSLPTPSAPEPATIAMIAPAFLTLWNKNKKIARTK